MIKNAMTCELEAFWYDKLLCGVCSTNLPRHCFKLL